MTSPRRRRLTTGLVFVCAWIVVASLALSAWTFIRQSQADTVRQAMAAKAASEPLRKVVRRRIRFSIVV